ncbi:hypothetical protein JCM5353_004766 [Sporobolomyces roseus]
MALDLSNPALELSFSPHRLSIIQFSPTQKIPIQLVDLLVTPGKEVPFLSITRTPAEVSIIVPSKILNEIYPHGAASTEDSPLETSGPWLALIVKGPMDLSLTGILHALTGPLKVAEVPVFASSTWDTDYVLINEEKQEVAKKALEAEGWRFAQ